MSDVLLGQSYYLRFDPKLWRTQRPYPPLGSLWAAACVRQAGHEVVVFDAMLATSESQWDEALHRCEPRVAVIYEDNFNYLSKMCLSRMRLAAMTMIAAAKARGCRVVICGSDATDRPDVYLQAGADLVICGEGEQTLIKLLPRLLGSSSSREDFARVEGLCFLDAEGSLRKTPPRSVMRDLDALPSPAWDLIDLRPYAEIWRRAHGRFSLNLATTRGCPFHCNWCAKPIWGQRYNSRSPAAVADEMRHVRDAHSVDHVWFADDIMGLQPGWLSRLADCLGQRGIVMPFKCLSRADLLLRDGEIEALAAAGCEIVWIGAESGSQRVLDAMEKGTTVEQTRAAASKLRDHGIQVGFFLQFGYPGEMKTDIAATRRLLRECRPDEIGMSISYPLPGTPFYERVRSQLGAKRNWRDSDDLSMLYDGPYSTAFYRQLYLVVQHEFLRDLGLRRLRAMARRPADWRPALLRRLAAVIFHTLWLPMGRLRLAVTSWLPHEGVERLAAGMEPSEAATPTAQT